MTGTLSQVARTFGCEVVSPEHVSAVFVTKFKGDLATGLEKLHDLRTTHADDPNHATVLTQTDEITRIYAKIQNITDRIGSFEGKTCAVCLD